MRKDWLKMARVLGICPTIDSPIKSNDGYLIRFRPKYGYLSSKQLSILADAISSFGSNFIELTSRANITVRGLQKKNILNSYQISSIRPVLLMLLKKRRIFQISFIVLFLRKLKN
jgi:sulfite reductase beta subunit-like hemoprotein